MGSGVSLMCYQVLDLRCWMGTILAILVLLYPVASLYSLCGGGIRHYCAQGVENVPRHDRQDGQGQAERTSTAASLDVLPNCVRCDLDHSHHQSCTELDRSREPGTLSHTLGCLCYCARDRVSSSLIVLRIAGAVTLFRRSSSSICCKRLLRHCRDL